MIKIKRIKELKEAIKDLPDDMYFVVGKENDKFGRNDMKVRCIQRRTVGFDDEPEQYLVLCCDGIDLSGCLDIVRM